MPDITVNSRTLDFVGEVKVRLINPVTNKPQVYTKTEILANSAVEAVLTTLVAPDANSVEGIKSDYGKDGSDNVLDVDGGIYVNTYALGKEVAYDTVDYNSNLFLDVTA